MLISFAAELAAIVGADHVRPATPADAVDGVTPAWAVAPGSAEEVAALLARADAAGAVVVPRGSGTKLTWGNQPEAADLLLEMRRLDALLEHAWGDMTATVQAGCTVARLQSALAEQGQRLALDPLWPERATVGGMLATNDSGSLRARFGSLRDLVLGVTVALPDGTLAKSGGKVVKNVAGYDLPKLMTGALGTLGVITEATFRLHPMPADTLSFSIGAPGTAEATGLLRGIADSSLVPTGVQFRASGDMAPAVDVHIEGIAAALDGQIAMLCAIVRAAGCGEAVGAGPEVWRAREALWEGEGAALVCKLGVLPAEMGRLCVQVAEVAAACGLGWRLVAQAVGVATLRLEGDGPALPAALSALRAALAAAGGSVVVLDCPPEMKPGLDAWGAAGDALPLMRRVKAEFDPRRTLNPGRFVGGI
ncbi:MAG: FAD-binding oxidoreductase [Chloroflexia bacterium]